MGYYEKLGKINIAEAVQAMGLRMDYDGKVRVPYHLELDNAWIEQGFCPKRHCLLWKDFMFDKFQVIHPGCVSCWKTYCKPKDLKELFRIYEIQKTEKKRGIVPACKCGIETRSYSGNLGGYGAFWYNTLGCGLKKARENTERLSEVYGIELFLKRGCTEMEQFTISRLGKDSSEWGEIWEYGKEKLKILELTFLIDMGYKKARPLPLVLKTEKRWIDWAIQHGDMTYLDFCDGRKIPELRQYFGSIDKAEEIDDGTIWRDYYRCGVDEERIGGVHGKQEETLLTSLEGL